MLESTGKLIYDPRARIKNAPWWCILKTDEEIVRYYKEWLKKFYDVEFEKTVWGSHVSVVRGTEPSNKSVWKKYQGYKINFTYTNNIYRAHWFYCVDVQSAELEAIRQELGLTPVPKHGFHLTIGRINKLQLQRAAEARKVYTDRMTALIKLVDEYPSRVQS